MPDEKIDLTESFLLDDGEDVHIFTDGDYQGVLDMSLYDKAFNDIEKTIRLPTEPQLNILLFDVEKEFDELPEEIEYYDENIQSIKYRDASEGLKEVFRDSPSKENPPVANLLIKASAALSGLVLTEGIKNKMKNRGMLPRAVSESQPHELKNEFADETPGYEVDDERENPGLLENPKKPPSGSIAEDFRYTRDNLPAIWNAITDSPWEFEEGLPKSLRDDMPSGNSFTQSMIDDLEEVANTGDVSGVGRERAKKIWDFLYNTNLLIWSRAREEPGSLSHPVYPGSDADYWIKEGVGVEGQSSRMSRSEWTGDVPHRSVIPAGTRIAIRDYTLRVLVDYPDKSDPNSLEVGVVYDVLDFGGLFFPALIASQDNLTTKSYSNAFVTDGGPATNLLNENSRRPRHHYGYIKKSDRVIETYPHYMKRSERSSQNRQGEIDFSLGNQWTKDAESEYVSDMLKVVNKEPVEISEDFSFTNMYMGVTNTEYCVVRFDLNEMDDEFNLGVFTENFEGEFAFVLPRTMVSLEDDGMWDYINVDTPQSIKKFEFTGIYGWDESQEFYRVSADGWNDKYSKSPKPRDFITWFYLKYGMVASRRNDTGNPAVPHAMISSPDEDDDAFDYALETTRAAFGKPNRDIDAKLSDDSWSANDDDLYGLQYSLNDAQAATDDDDGEFFFEPQNEDFDWSDYKGPEYGHWKSRHNKKAIVNVHEDVSTLKSAADTVDETKMDTKVDEHPPPPSPGDEEEDEEEEEEGTPDVVSDGIPEGLEDLAGEEDLEDMLDIDEVAVPNLTHLETSDDDIAKGLYPFPFESEHPMLPNIFVSDMWKYTSWDSDDIDNNRPDFGYLDELYKKAGVEYLFLVNLEQGEIAYSNYEPSYDGIDEDGWLSKFENFLGFSVDKYVLLAYTSDTIKADMYELGGEYYPVDCPTHVLVEKDVDDEDKFSWKVVPIQSAETIHFFDTDTVRGQKIFDTVKEAHKGLESEPTWDDVKGIAAVGVSDGVEKLSGSIVQERTWSNWKDALMEALDIPDDMSNQPCIMYRASTDSDDSYPITDEKDRLKASYRQNPPVDLSGSLPTEVDVEPGLGTKLDNVEGLPRDEIEYEPNEDKIPRVPKHKVTGQPVFHNPDEPVWVSGEGAGDEPGKDGDVEEPESQESEDAWITEEFGLPAPLSNPEGDENLSRAMSQIRKDVEANIRGGRKTEERVPVYQRPFEPSFEPDAHFEKVASIDDVISDVFAFPDEMTRAMVMCSTLNEDWVTLLKGIPGTGKTVLAHLIMMSFMNDIDFQTDEINTGKVYTDDVVSNYLQTRNVWGVTKHNQDKQPDDVFYETEIRMTESRAPEEAIMATEDWYSRLVDHLDDIYSMSNWRQALKSEGYTDEDIKKIEFLKSKLGDWKDVPAEEKANIEAAGRWLDRRFESGTDDADAIKEIMKGQDILRENIPKDIKRQLEAVEGRTTLTSVRDYVFKPRRKPIVESLIKYHNEANRANPNVADTMLGLIAEKQVEYLGKPLSSPVFGQKYPCLHYMDYNPHLDMREDQELDRALLDRANMGIYLRQADIRGRQNILWSKYGVDFDSDGDASSKSVEEQLIARANRGIEADGGFEPLSYLELQEVWNVVDQVPLTYQQVMLINVITQHFSMLYKQYDEKAYDVKDVSENIIDSNFVDVIEKKRQRFFSERPAEFTDSSSPEWKADFVDTSTIAYIDAKQQAGTDIGGGAGAGEFNKETLLNQVDRELGLRSAESLVKLMKAYAYYKAARRSVSQSNFEINDMTDFQNVIEDEWIPLLLSYVIEHRINIGVMDTLQTSYFNFGDFVDGWYLPQVLVESEDDSPPPLWLRWKIWTKCAHPNVSSNAKELIDNVLEVVELKKDELPSGSALQEKLQNYDSQEALFNDIDGNSAEPTIQLIFNSVSRNR